MYKNFKRACNTERVRELEDRTYNQHDREDKPMHDSISGLFTVFFPSGEWETNVLSLQHKDATLAN